MLLPDPPSESSPVKGKNQSQIMDIAFTNR